MERLRRVVYANRVTLLKVQLLGQALASPVTSLMRCAAHGPRPLYSTASSICRTPIRWAERRGKLLMIDTSSEAR